MGDADMPMKVGAAELAVLSTVGERFELREQLGRGAMGVVFRAYDRMRRGDVALKTLQRFDGAALYRFKQEFRSLAGIVHPNLVTLYELQSEGDAWFFTMELVNAEPFLSYVRPGAPPLEQLDSAEPRRLAEHSESETYDTVDLSPTQLAAGLPEPSVHVSQVRAAWRAALAAAPLDVDRLRATLRQLAEGVVALHGHGKLHRDLKPSNVLVDPAGRVHICDFGLVTEAKVDLHSYSRPGAREFGGTPSYMAPEQFANLSATRASDWYAVGVLLFEALTAQLPFVGSLAELAEQKQRLVPPSPAGVVAEPGALPDDLVTLCQALLHRDPARRPSGEQVLAHLGASTRAAPLAVSRAADIDFIGREAQLQALRDALAHSRSGRSVTVFVHGLSGMGKSALIQRFLGELRAFPSAVLLEGRCYERESVPYKALDALVDALSHYLLGLSAADRESLLSPDITSLARVFPVVSKVIDEMSPADLAQPPGDAKELRHRAFAALRSILQHVGERNPTAVYIDDLQWGDLDSAAFLLDLIHNPSSPPILLIGSYRSDEVDTSHLLRALRRPPATGISGEVRTLQIGPLERGDASRLALAVLGDIGSDALRLAGDIADEAAGHPLFVAELARASATADGTLRRGASLDQVLGERIAGLADDARALLTATAVVGRPIALSVVSRAAEVRDEASALATLQAARLVRTLGGETERVEPYHDRIRETVMAQLSERDSRRAHRRVARALETESDGDLLALVELWIGAGDRAKAALYAARAAAQAEQALAFDRAASHYRLVLELAELSAEERRKVRKRLGDALASAGALSEAADAYLAAAEGAERELALELRRLALEQHLRLGRVDASLTAARAVLREVGVTLPRGRIGILLSILSEQRRVARRGLGLKPPAAAGFEHESLLRMDTYFSLASGLTYVDPFLGMAIRLRFLREALEVGEPIRAALAVSLEMGYRGTAGRDLDAGYEEARRRAHELADATGDDYVRGFALTTEGTANFLRGEFEAARANLAAGERTLIEQARGARWAIDMARIYGTASLFYLGRIRELVEVVPRYVAEALEVGDVNLSSALRSWRSNPTWLALGDHEEARRQALEAARDRPLEGRFHLQHYFQVLSHAQIDLYAGDGEAAGARVEAAWKPLKKSMLLRVQATHVEAQFLRARAALGAAATGRAPKAGLARAERCARVLAKLSAPWAHPLAALTRAGLAQLRRDDERAAALLATAAQGADEHQMRLVAAAARQRLGRLLRGDEGAALVHTATAWMRSEHIADPERMAAIFCPW
jgi:serine/threonine protein kinase